MSDFQKKFSVTHLRANLYKILDKIINTGQSISLDRKGHKIVIGLEQETHLFDKLPKRVLTPVGLSEKDLIYHDLGKYDPDPLLYKTDNPDTLIAAEPDNEKTIP